MEQDERSVKADRKFTVVEQAGGIHQVYANHVTIDWTAYDIRLRVGEVSIPGTPDNPGALRLEQRAAVSLTWAKAKNLRDDLTDVILKFEELNGEIKQPVIP